MVFCQKISIFFKFSFNTKWINKVFGELPERLESPLDYKNVDYKSPKGLDHVFFSKNLSFSNFFLMQNGALKSVL